MSSSILIILTWAIPFQSWCVFFCDTVYKQKYKTIQVQIQVQVQVVIKLLTFTAVNWDILPVIAVMCSPLIMITLTEVRLITRTIHFIQPYRSTAFAVTLTGEVANWPDTTRIIHNINVKCIRAIILTNQWKKSTILRENITSETRLWCTTCIKRKCRIGKKVKVLYSRKWKYSVNQLRSVTCHMGSHSVTCYPTQVNTPRLNPVSYTHLTLPTNREV